MRQRLDRHAAGVLLLVAAWLGATAWMRPLMLPDEGRYAGVAREMLGSGDWLTPTLNGLPFFHKPPLFYWITAAGLAVLGENPFAARLASLVGGLALAFSLFIFARRWLGIDTAQRALLVLVTLPMVYVGSQFANLDMLVAGCIGSTVLLLAHAALRQDEGQPPGPALPAAYVAAALGVLAKGLIGFVLPALVVGAWLLATRRWRRLPGLLSPLGTLAFMAIALPWFIAVQWRYPDFAHYFFIVQHVQRYTGADFNNLQPWWFYPLALLVLGLPWTSWLLRLRRPAPDLPATPQRSVRILSYWWLALVLVFFSLPHSKLIGYVLPALPPLALLIAQCAPTSRRGLQAWRAGAVAALLMCVGSVLVLALHEPKTWQPLAAAMQEGRREGEPVLFVGDYFYDVAFHAGLRSRPVVVDAWDDPDIARHDDWRKVLADGAAFAPALAAQVLMTPAQVAPFLCANSVTWVFATDVAARQFDWVRRGATVRQWHGAALWRIDGSRAQAPPDPACPPRGTAPLV